MVTGSQLPRRVRDLTETEKFMDKIRTDKQEGNNEMKLMSHKKRIKEKERLKKKIFLRKLKMNRKKKKLMMEI